MSDASVFAFEAGDRVRQTLPDHRPPLIRTGVVLESVLVRAHPSDPSPPQYPCHRVDFGEVQAWAFPNSLELLGRDLGPLFGGTP